jgi:hypothetical protein
MIYYSQVFFWGKGREGMGGKEKPRFFFRITFDFLLFFFIYLQEPRIVH